MDSSEVSPLPNLTGFAHGNTPIDVYFDKSLLNTETQYMTVKGLVADHSENLEIPGVRVAIGSLDSTGNKTYFFTARTSVMTDHKGEFSLNTKINKSDILIVVWLGYLEKVYSFRKIAK